jgi:predicted XRE-type DNA-binding protein
MTQLSYDNIFDAITDNKDEAADLRFRADLMLIMRDIFELKKWTQSDIMSVLEVSQPRASELMRGKVDKFSSDKLISFLSKLGFRVRPKLILTESSAPNLECPVSY